MHIRVTKAENVVIDVKDVENIVNMSYDVSDIGSVYLPENIHLHIGEGGIKWMNRPRSAFAELGDGNSI